MPRPTTTTGALRFGKHAGTPIADVPADYLEWLIGSSNDVIDQCKNELQRRKDVEEANQSFVEKLVNEGYRSMCKKTHPDAGGNAEDFRNVQAAYEQLKVILKELKGV